MLTETEHAAAIEAAISAERDRIRSAVYDFPAGCDDGKRDFLRTAGLIPPAPKSVTVVVTFIPTDEAWEGDIADEIESALDCSDFVQGCSGFVKLMVDSPNNHANRTSSLPFAPLLEKIENFRAGFVATGGEIPQE